MLHRSVRLFTDPDIDLSSRRLLWTKKCRARHLMGDACNRWFRTVFASGATGETSRGKGNSL